MASQILHQILILPHQIPKGKNCVTTKRVQLQNDIGNSEEIFVGWTTHIQHAVRVDPAPKPGAPTFEGIAWRSMCGARLNPT